MAKNNPEDSIPKVSEPSNQEYLSYYVYQGEWKPTRPIGPIGAMSSSPGPAIVNLPPTIGEEGHDPTKEKAPGYKMGIRLRRGETKIGPGPAAYDVSSMTNMGKDICKAPKIGKADRFRQHLGTVSPGPAVYSRHLGDRSVYPRAPAFSVPHAKRGQIQTATGPAPNAYTLPPAIGAGKTPLVVGPSYSIGKASRMSDGRIQQNPGPAAYMLPSTDINMSKAPAYSISTKAAPPRGATWSPGPAAHSAHMVKFDKYSTPRITFGIKHSPFKALPGFDAQK